MKRNKVRLPFFGRHKHSKNKKKIPHKLLYDVHNGSKIETSSHKSSISNSRNVDFSMLQIAGTNIKKTKAPLKRNHRPLKKLGCFIYANIEIKFQKF